jgi:transcriptional regulator with XRE-family HTH domain
MASSIRGAARGGAPPAVGRGPPIRRSERFENSEARALPFDSPMTTVAATASRKSLRTANGRRSHSTTTRVVREIDTLRRDCGVTLSALARAAGVDQGYLSQVVAGRREPSIAVLTALASALGGDLSLRVYPGSGPALRDGIQARIVEELLRIAAATWRPSVEVAVTHPSRGFIDVVFHEARQSIFVTTEVQSRIDRLEQQIRWANDKAVSLPSSDMWQFTDGEALISRLLVVRSTVASRELARRFGATLAAAYPARCADVHAALTTADVAWPGPGILWADVRGDVVRILDRPPRGVAAGR